MPGGSEEDISDRVVEFRHGDGVSIGGSFDLAAKVRCFLNDTFTLLNKE